MPLAARVSAPIMRLAPPSSAVMAGSAKRAEARQARREVSIKNDDGDNHGVTAAWHGLGAGIWHVAR